MGKMKYKLWIEIEEHEEGTDVYRNITQEGLAEPVPMGEVETLHKAVTLAESYDNVLHKPIIKVNDPIKKAGDK